MSKQLFAVNVTASNLQMKRGFFYIDRGSFKPITEDDARHPDFTYAVEKGWIKITDEEPKEGASFADIKTVNVVEAPKGMTIDELKAAQAKQVTEPAATTEAIGKQEEPVDEKKVEEAPVTEEKVEEKAKEEPVTEKKAEEEPKAEEKTPRRARKAASKKAAE